MDLGTIRTLNLVGTLLFTILGVVVPLFYLGAFGMALMFGTEEGLFAICLTVLIVWIIFVLYFAYLLYKNTVIALDNRNYELVKRWTLYGVIAGFLFGGGILTAALFLISHISLDDALKPKYYGYPPYPYYPPPPTYPYGPPPAYPQYPPQQQYPQQQYPPSIGIKGQQPVQPGYKIKQQQPVTRAQTPRAQPRTRAQQPVKYAVKERRRGKPGDKD
jgi:hypothetical protein